MIYTVLYSSEQLESCILNPLFSAYHTTYQKKTWCFFIIFGTKIKQKPIEKTGKTQCATKVDESMVPGTTFWAKG